MDFRLEFTPPPLKEKINLRNRLMLVGSCFTEQIGQKLARHKFNILDNPNGILFNPLSIASAINSYTENQTYRESDLFLQNELWGSWDHHTKFSALSPGHALDQINQSQKTAHDFLAPANWLMLTLGSAFVYELDGGRVVANCHKVPTDKFNKRLVPVAELLASLDEMIHRLKTFNPGLKILFTISPVRHLRDGFVENNRSKSALIQAVHQLVDKFDHCHYFPAYELIIDDLRDYRFYAEDMVHPSYAATNYVWEKFIASCIDEESKKIMEEINILNAARSHKPFNPSSNAHQSFLKKNLDRAIDLKNRYSFLDLDDDISFFKSGL